MMSLLSALYELLSVPSDAKVTSLRPAASTSVAHEVMRALDRCYLSVIGQYTLLRHIESTIIVGSNVSITIIQ